MRDAVPLLHSLLWLLLVTLFLVCIIGLAFSTRVFYVQARVAWCNPRRTGDNTSYRQWLLACVAAMAGVIVFALNAGVPILLRVGLMGSAAAVTWAVFAWLDGQFATWAEHKDERTRHWRAAAQEAGARLRRVSDAREVRPETMRILQQTLGANLVSLYVRGNDDFSPVYHVPSPPATPVVFSAQSLLVRELARFPGPRSLVTARKGQAVGWSRGSGLQLSVEQEQLKAIDAHLVVPLVVDRVVAGFLLFGSRQNEEQYSSAEIRYAEAVARQSTDRLFYAEQFQRDLNTRAEAIRREAAQEFAVAAKRFLLPPEKVDSGPVEVATGLWGNDVNKLLFYDIVALPRGAWGLVLAQIDAPEQDAAVRLVQLQALVRSRFSAYEEDLPALARSIESALQGPGGVPPVRLFTARCSQESPVFTFVNAGFFPPMLLRRNESGAGLLRILGETTPLNTQHEGEWSTGQVALLGGDLMVLANEAVTLASGPEGEALGEGRLIDTLLGWEEQPIGDLVSLARRTIEEHEGPGSADTGSHLLVVLRVRESAAPLLQ